MQRLPMLLGIVTDEGDGFPILVADPAALLALAGAAVAFWYFRRRRATA